MSATHRAAARVGLSTRYKGRAHPDTVAARAALVTEQLAADIERRLQDAPPLTDDQAERLARMLRGA